MRPSEQANREDSQCPRAVCHGTNKSSAHGILDRGCEDVSSRGLGIFTHCNRCMQPQSGKCYDERHASMQGRLQRLTATQNLGGGEDQNDVIDETAH